MDYLDRHSDLSEEYIGLCADMFAEYQKMKLERGYLDFDDLLEIFARVLEEKAALRKDIARLFEECLVDEMQDTNPLQFRILKQFSREGVRLFCVGDPAQSIYRFRGANFEHVYLFDKSFHPPCGIFLNVTQLSEYPPDCCFSNPGILLPLMFGSGRWLRWAGRSARHSKSDMTRQPVTTTGRKKMILLIY